jgi:hypothetical protein
MSETTTPKPLDYPAYAHQRCHGPVGYDDWTSFKTWLRDEFAFCCVFCRLRESWYPHGQDSFSVEHLKPRTLAPGLALDYENMLYACSHCNSNKREQWPVLDPCLSAYGAHLRVKEDGTIEAKSKAGRKLIRQLNLDDEEMNKIRSKFIRTARILWAHRDKPQGMQLYIELMGYPDNLPDLGVLRPPGNIRLDGIRFCHFERKRTGELPEVF